MGAAEVLLVALDAGGLLAADDALAADAGGAVPDGEEVLPVEVAVELCVRGAVPTGGKSRLQITQSSLTSSVMSS